MTWLLRGLAVLLAIGAIVAAYVGYRLSTQPPPAPPAIPTESAVQSLKPLRAGEPIRADDVALRPVAARPAGSFAATTEVVGQIPLANVAAGETLTRAHFPAADRQLLRSLQAGERAVAIKVDDVVGLGGFAQPGDRVDVLLFLRGTQETANVSSAQVVLADVRLLAYGESVQATAAEGDGAAGRAAEKLPGRARATTSSAVLAVPEAAAPRLMLAANSGTLRLSLRAADAAGRNAADPHLVRLADLAQAARPAEKPPARRAPAAAGVVIQEGTAVRTVGVPSR